MPRSTAELEANLNDLRRNVERVRSRRVLSVLAYRRNREENDDVINER
jgi:hypothetical protein